MNIRSESILYPIFPGVNDQPIQPSENSPGNGADFVVRYNNLIDAIAPRLLLDFSTTETDLGISFGDYVLMMLPVPYATYFANPNSINWEILVEKSTFNFNISEVQEPLTFGGLNTVFTVGLLAGGGYGGNSPLDDSYIEALEIEGSASFIDLPTVKTSDKTWNNLVGIIPLETNLKIKLRPTSTKPTVNQVIVSSPFQS